MAPIFLLLDELSISEKNLLHSNKSYNDFLFNILCILEPKLRILTTDALQTYVTPSKNVNKQIV